MNKISRYHRSIFFPDWAEKSLEEFLINVSGTGSLKFSTHAVEKIVDCSFNYGRSFLEHLLKVVKKGSLNLDRVFEFYSTETRIKKACFRYTLPRFPVDLILVISADGVIVTVFVTNKEDNHSTLNEKLYERSS